MNDSESRPGHNGHNTTTIGGQFREADPAANPNPAHKKIPTDSTHSAEPQSQTTGSESLNSVKEPQITEKPHFTKLHKVHKLHSEPPEPASESGEQNSDPCHSADASHEPQATSREGEVASPAFTPGQQYVLEIIALGGALSAAPEDLHCRASCISSWKKRKPHFGKALIEARVRIYSVAAFGAPGEWGRNTRGDCPACGPCRPWLHSLPAHGADGFGFRRRVSAGEVCLMTGGVGAAPRSWRSETACYARFVGYDKT